MLWNVGQKARAVSSLDKKTQSLFTRKPRSQINSLRKLCLWKPRHSNKPRVDCFKLLWIAFIVVIADEI